MSSSFYGGRDGAPMVIKKSFSTVSDMVTEFSKIDYREVNFGEYALIRSANRNNPENGRLFRRDKDFNNQNRTVTKWEYNTTQKTFISSEISAGGATLIGLLAGPDGSTPQFELMGNRNLDELKQIHTQHSDPLITEMTLIPNTDALIAGNPTDNNNKITFTAYSFRDNNANSSTVYLDISTPYNVIEWSKKQLPSQSQVTLTEKAKNAFYQKYELGIPKGQDGTSFNNIRVITPTASDKVVTITFDANRNITATDYADLQDDIFKGRKIWVADVVDYKTTDDGTQYLVYLGDYDTIKNINLTDEGLFTVEYYHNNKYTANLKWPISTSLAADGTYTTVFNDNTSTSQTESNRLKWVTGTSLDPDGTYTTIYNYGNPTIESNKLKWPTNIKVNSNGTITTEYNYGSSITQENPTMNWISSAELDKENTLKINYLNNKNVEQQNIVVPLKTVNSIRYDGIDGRFYVTYNTGQEEDSIGAIGSSTLDAVIASEENEDTNSLRIGGIWFVTQE